MVSLFSVVRYMLKLLKITLVTKVNTLQARHRTFSTTFYWNHLVESTGSGSQVNYINIWPASVSTIHLPAPVNKGIRGELKTYLRLNQVISSSIMLSPRVKALYKITSLNGNNVNSSDGPGSLLVGLDSQPTSSETKNYTLVGSRALGIVWMTCEADEQPR